MAHAKDNYKLVTLTNQENIIFYLLPFYTFYSPNILYNNKIHLKLLLLFGLKDDDTYYYYLLIADFELLTLLYMHKVLIATIA
jgi:hypothetical protein